VLAWLFVPLPLTVSCFSKIQIGFTFLVPVHPGSPGHRAVKRVCVCVLLSQEIGWEERLLNDLFYVGWDSKPQPVSVCCDVHVVHVLVVEVWHDED